jgi:hypothetical protein
VENGGEGERRMEEKKREEWRRRKEKNGGEGERKVTGKTSLAHARAASMAQCAVVRAAKK